jgi:hypothetical protein
MSPLVPLLLLLFSSVAYSVNSTYVSTPGIAIRSPLPNSKLILDISYLILDPDAGLFYLNVSSYFSDGTVSGDLPVATAIGNLAFQSPGVILFSYPSENSSYCQQARSSPSLCGSPAYLQQITNGEFTFGAHPSTGAVTTLTIESSTSNPNPNPLGPLNFLGAYQAITYSCVGVCEELQSQVPQPESINVTVRRSLLLLELMNGGLNMANVLYRL